MNLQFAPDPREVYFFCIAAAGNLIEEKKIPRVGGKNGEMKWDVAALIFIF